jgi:hypothetical protein
VCLQEEEDGKQEREKRNKKEINYLVHMERKRREKRGKKRNFLQIP